MIVPVRRHDQSVFFNGQNLADFGVHVSGFNTLNSPERDYEFIEVPGKSGDLVIDKKRFKNVNLSYEAWIADDLKQNVRGLRSFLLGSKGYKRLEDTYNPDEYRLATFVGPIEFDIVQWKAGQFDLEFNCKPQRYLKNGEIPISCTSQSNKLYNGTFNIAKPKIRVSSWGEFRIYCESRNFTVTVASHSGIPYIDIDCELGDCYYDATNCNKYVSFSENRFPEFDPGEIVFEFVSISGVSVTPNWYVI